MRNQMHYERMFDTISTKRNDRKRNKKHTVTSVSNSGIMQGDEEGPGLETVELEPVFVVEHHEPLDAPAAAPTFQEGRVIVPNPYGGADDEEVCGVCLENPGPGKLASLWCCRNVLCLNDAQMIGVCPFCRNEPLIWCLKP